jgi:hypothetical protein
MEKGPPHGSKTLSAKVPARLAERFDELARNRRVSRSYLFRELIEALFEGRVILRAPPPDTRTIGQFAASDVSMATREQARDAAEAACRGVEAEPVVAEAASNAAAVARRAARLLAEGR